MRVIDYHHDDRDSAGNHDHHNIHRDHASAADLHHLVHHDHYSATDHHHLHLQHDDDSGADHDDLLHHVVHHDLHHDHDSAADHDDLFHHDHDSAADHDDLL